MDGIQLCSEISGIRNDLRNPVVVLMLTASENKEDMARGLEAGADDFVGKSSDVAVVKGRIRALLRPPGQPHAFRQAERASFSGGDGEVARRNKVSDLSVV